MTEIKYSIFIIIKFIVKQRNANTVYI